MRIEGPVEVELSRREQQVFRLLLKGMPNKEIASLLEISSKTVEEHLSSIYRKTGANSRSQAILWAMSQDRDFPH